VPAVVWGPGMEACGARRMHERAVAGAEVVQPGALLARVAEVV
jgi:hypothetical protein